jgi:hypothetical protein
MLTDEKRSVRQLAIKKIIAARKINEKSKKFTVPRINFNSDSYANLSLCKKKVLKVSKVLKLFKFEDKIPAFSVRLSALMTLFQVFDGNSFF